jgi:ribosomal-protein-alanine N-acetyltransferase
MIRIRDAGEPDIPAVMNIEEEAFSPPWSEGALLNQIGRDDGLFAVAVEGDADNGGQVLGFIIIRRAADEAELYQIAVREDERRRGIAAKLMEAALADCRRHGTVSMYLEVRRGNQEAIALYKKFGFKVEGRRKNYYSSPVEDAVVMSRLLSEV